MIEEWKKMSMDNKTSFSEQSHLYASARPRYPEALFRYLASLCSSQETAWDCATGSGQSALSLATHFTSVKATDVSAAQIQNAFAHARIEYSVQPAENTTFSHHEFDLITVAQALHWFNLNEFWVEVERVLKPGGVFATWGYSWFRISPEIDRLIETWILRKIQPYWAKENQLLWNGYEDVNFPMTLLSPQQFSLQLNWTLDQLFSYLQTWSAMKRCISQEGEPVFTEAKEAIREIWGDLQEAKDVVMDLPIKVGQKDAF